MITSSNTLSQGHPVLVLGDGESCRMDEIRVSMHILFTILLSCPGPHYGVIAGAGRSASKPIPGSGLYLDSGFLDFAIRIHCRLSMIVGRQVETCSKKALKDQNYFSIM